MRRSGSQGQLSRRAVSPGTLRRSRRPTVAQFHDAVEAPHMLLIPSIDLRGGKCVRLLKGDFSAETRYEFAPDELMWRYQQLGASWLHLVDLDSARDGGLSRDN